MAANLSQAQCGNRSKDNAVKSRKIRLVFIIVIHNSFLNLHDNKKNIYRNVLDATDKKDSRFRLFTEPPPDIYSGLVNHFQNAIIMLKYD